MSDEIRVPASEQTRPGSFIGPEQRATAWDRLGSEQFDVVVIGGGVVGSGAALDAATRGLKVALVEARDFASGTSSRSSKMFHGGLRYLEQLEFGLVREALFERELSLTTLAPHLVKPLPFLYPLTKRWRVVRVPETNPAGSARSPGCESGRSRHGLLSVTRQ